MIVPRTFLNDSIKIEEIKQTYRNKNKNNDPRITFMPIDRFYSVRNVLGIQNIILSKSGLFFNGWITSRNNQYNNNMYTIYYICI